MVNGLSGERMLIGLAIGIAVLIFLVLKTKIQAFLALIISTVVVGVIGGMPLTNITIEVDGVEKTFGIVNSITSGFGGTLGSIGIIIGFGVMMGQIFEVTGAAKRMAHTFLKLFGKKREEEALALTGFLVSIPIFCDSGFVVLAPIAKAISKATKKSVIGLGTALAAGLVITHSPGTTDTWPVRSLRNLWSRRRKIHPADTGTCTSDGNCMYRIFKIISFKEILQNPERRRRDRRDALPGA